MSRIRLLLALLTTAFAVAPLFAGPSLFKRKVPPAKVPALIETLKSDRDEKKRKAAADELGGADPRLNPEVATALAIALRKDPSASVRVEAAESLGQLGYVFPLGGQALEAAANDPSTMVRLAAKRSLWEYHLNGYRTSKGNDDTAVQTVEPPIALPPGPRQAVAIVPVSMPLPPVKPLIPVLPPTQPTVSMRLPPVAPPTGPRVARLTFLAELFPGTRVANRSLIDATPPAILNLTSEPPIAKRPAITIPELPAPPAPVPPPTLTVIPSAPPVSVPDYDPKLPSFMPDLPSVVLPPEATPLPPMPTPTPKIPRIPATLPPLGGGPIDRGGSNTDR